MAINSKPLTSKEIALTEKKMNMTLDDIIKMSKPTKKAKTRVLNKNAKTFNNTTQDRTVKAKQYLASRNAMRQGALSKRRSNYQDNQFPLATAAAMRAVTAPVCPNGFPITRIANWNNQRVATQFSRRTNAGFNIKHQPYQQKSHANVVPWQRSQTLDSLFANMKEQRLKTQQSSSSRGRAFQERQQFQQQRPSQGGQRQQHGRSWFAH